MANANPMPTQIADAPDADFRGPFFEINPTAGPTVTMTSEPHVAAAAAPRAPAHAPQHVPAVCAPAPASVGGSPIEVHEPRPGQHVEITVTPNQALIFDFNPLDAQAVRHGNDLTLTFADGGVLVLHHIAQDGTPLPTALQLPDGTIINPCELLQALPEEQPNPTAGKIPEEKIPQPNPEAGPEQPNPEAGAPPVTTPFDVPGLGEGLTPLGPLGAEGFNTTFNFPPPGSGGFPPGPPGTPPNTPPNTPPSTPFLVAIEDSNLGVVPNLVDNPGQTTLTITGNFVTDFANSGGIHGVNGAPSLTFSNPVSVNTGTATGMFGKLALASDGTYTYTVDVAGQAAVNHLASDRISEALNQQYSGAAPYLAPLEDEFVVTVTNGTQTTQELLALYIEGANAKTTTTAVTGTAGSTLLLTYTDLYNPAHSFSELVTVNAGAHSFTTDIPIQPGDPALVSLALVSGGPTSITSIEVGGGTITVPSETLDAAHHAITAMIDPQVTPGTTYSVLDGPTVWTDVPAGGTATQLGQYLYAEGHGVTLNVAADSAADVGTDSQHPGGVVLNLGNFAAGTGIEQGGLGSDTLVWNAGGGTTYYNGTAGAVVQGTATAGDQLHMTFTNQNLATPGHVETITIAVGAGETTAQMTQDVVNAINGDANLTGIGLSAVYGGGSSFQMHETPGSLSFGQTQYTEFTTPAVFGTAASESIQGNVGLDTLKVEAANQTLNFTNGTINAANIEVVDLGSTAAGSGNSSLTLTPDSVLHLTQNETSTVTSFSGAGANGQPIQAIWILGDASDTVNLNGFVSGSNPDPMISGPITSGAQDPIPGVVPPVSLPAVPAGVDVNGAAVTTAPTSPTQMVGFTEFSGTAANGNTVHVYVENAIATSGHVHVH